MCKDMCYQNGSITNIADGRIEAQECAATCLSFARVVRPASLYAPKAGTRTREQENIYIYTQKDKQS